MAGVFLLLILLIGGSFIGLSLYFAEQYFAEAQQRLHAPLAQHLIDEKFQEGQPFMPDGGINKELFGGLMHDMMAVNQSIEVYLLAPDGQVRYSVVLDERQMAEGEFYVDLDPVRTFLTAEGQAFVLGDDPLSPGERRIFSAAEFDLEGQKGFIYIILTGQMWQTLSDALLESYTLRGGVLAFVLALLFALLIGLIMIGYLTKRLRRLVAAMQEFEDGDMEVRLEVTGQDEIARLGHHFNRMASAIWENFEAVKSTERLRQDLIANVSHDLRTPLAVIHGYAETLQLKGSSLPEEDRERYIRVVLRNATKLKKQVEELFELSKLEAKQVKPKPEAFSLEEFLIDMQEQYRMLAQEKAIVLKVDTQTSHQEKVWADLSLIERVCQNLLDNALKFTPAGGEISLRVRESERPGWLSIEVADTGVGISEEDLPHIFDRYATRKRVDQPQTGTGLGLAIAKKIMELHDSTLRVRSQIQQGTSFRFELKGV